MQMTLPAKPCSQSEGTPIRRFLNWIRDPNKHNATKEYHRESLDEIHGEIVTLRLKHPERFPSKYSD